MGVEPKVGVEESGVGGLVVPGVLLGGAVLLAVEVGLALEVLEAVAVLEYEVVPDRVIVPVLEAPEENGEDVTVVVLDGVEVLEEVRVL